MAPRLYCVITVYTVHIVKYCAYYMQTLACVSPSPDVSPRLERNVRRPDQTPHLSLDMRRPNTETFSIRGTRDEAQKVHTLPCYHTLRYQVPPRYPPPTSFPRRRHAAYHSLPHHTSPHITSQRQPAASRLLLVSPSHPQCECAHNRPGYQHARLPAKSFKNSSKLLHLLTTSSKHHCHKNRIPSFQIYLSTYRYCSHLILVCVFHFDPSSSTSCNCCFRSISLRPFSHYVSTNPRCRPNLIEYPSLFRHSHLFIPRNSRRIRRKGTYFNT